MGGLLLRIRTWWETADRTQKVVTLVGGGFLAVLLVGTFYFASRPKMEMVFGGLSSQEQGMVIDEIRKLGVAVDFDVQGNVLVPSNKVAEVRAKLAVSGKLPTKGHMGVGELANFGMMNTSRVEQERLKAVLEGELATSIEFIDGVQSARVHVSLGERTPFVSDRREASASVTIQENLGRNVGPEQAVAIARLVARAVPGLDTKNVTIVNGMGQMIYDGLDQEGTNGMIAKKLDAEVAEARRREREIQGMLDGVFGPGTTVAKINLELDFDKRSVKKREQLPTKDPLQTESSVEKMTNRGTIPGARFGSGAEANIAAPADADPTLESGGYSGKQEAVVYAHSETHTTIEESSGQLKKMSITVLVDSAKIENASPVEEAIESYIQPWASDQTNFSTSVVPVQFDRSTEQAAQQAAQATASRERTQQILSLLPLAALLFVGVMVVRSISKATKSENVLVAATPDGRWVPVPAGSVASSELAVYEGDDVEGIESAAAADVARALQSGQPIEDIGSIDSKIDVPLEQIKKMTNERPEAVAMLIKSWLLEEKR
jgi:flagellar M-ring protein FliF